MTVTSVIVRGLLAATAFAIAPIVALQAQVNAGGLAPGWAEAWNGFRMADIALSQAHPKVVAGQLKIQPDVAALAVAQKAYALEPFASNAHFLLSLKSEKNRIKVLEASQAIDQRNRLAGMVLLQDALQRDDLPGIFPLIDRMSRLEPEIAAEIVKAFTTSLNYPSSMLPLAQALRSNPPWATSFWRNVPDSDPALANFMQLRGELAPAVDVQSDTNLIRVLVTKERFSEAFEVYRKVRHTSSQTKGHVDAGQFPPLDWDFAKGRDANARLAPSGQLDVFVDQGSSGDLARKLVMLSPGIYKLDGRLEKTQGSGNLSAELRCASAGVQETQWERQLLGQEVSWRVSSRACQFAWLELKGSAWESTLPLKATILGFGFSKN
ncbi:hypothetical protein GRI44_00910 [Altererythrobacter confluentis]|uniref:Uncharacterized protein n=1 Tax=Allopontixanthobacter confluentis TaxID=1849021 RepID=A0A6L7GBH2_9SPHN|nr:hypothetical protein [Allopontixanthobacter confluentis]MXP13319.1 hypothetical protein [Allopontixanthobacter confluentis]